jgi:hypothetical protein
MDIEHGEMGVRRQRDVEASRECVIAGQSTPSLPHQLPLASTLHLLGLIFRARAKVLTDKLLTGHHRMFVGWDRDRLPGGTDTACILVRQVAI